MFHFIHNKQFLIHYYKTLKFGMCFNLVLLAKKKKKNKKKKNKIKLHLPVLLKTDLNSLAAFITNHSETGVLVLQGFSLTSAIGHSLPKFVLNFSDLVGTLSDCHF